ncbi:MAG: hypothetical protein HW388_950 [Dehalococcoidia bacterium]|nr:hypothetical protein [Dehalococcoidia bacterium]
MVQIEKTTSSRRVGFVDEAVSVSSERPDSEARKVIESVEYLQKIRAFLVRMGHGGIYLLKLDDLSEADSSPVARSRIGRGRTHFKVWQESGNQLAIPWDVVLYHCEPEYEYHKARSTQGQDNSRAVRIGTRVREVRLARGLTISELAQKAGMKRPNLSRLEHGRQAPSLDTLEQIAASLMVPVADLVRDVH